MYGTVLSLSFFLDPAHRSTTGLIFMLYGSEGVFWGKDSNFGGWDNKACNLGEYAPKTGMSRQFQAKCKCINHNISTTVSSINTLFEGQTRDHQRHFVGGPKILYSKSDICHPDEVTTQRMFKLK